MTSLFAFLLIAAGGYAEPESCGACHAGIAANYRGVAMAQSAGRFTKDDLIEDFQTNNSFYHAASDRHYRMEERNGRYFQRRWQVDEHGREAHVFERQITHFIGSGRHARTYLYLAPSGELTQLPVTWYTQEGRWAMSPGYDSERHFDFSRTVDFGCLFCHAAYPNLAAGADTFGRRPLFPDGLPGAIGCQRCHGPGLRHADLARTQAAPAAARSSIVNPKRLTPGRRIDVCLQCHLQTTSEPLPHAIRRFGRGAFSFRPGEPLSSYVVHFARPRETFEINGHGHRLLASACYANSGGKMTCTTCHDPHHAERGEAARAKSNRQCASCHKPHTVAGRADCVTCHMPRRRTEDAVHVVMTDHRIQLPVVGKDLLAPLTERHEDYRGPLAIAHTRGLSSADRRLYILSARCQGQGTGCAELAGASAVEARLLAARAASSIPLYREILTAAPGFSTARAEYAALLGAVGRQSEALDEYRKALAGPDAPPAAHAGIARLLISAGENAEAIEHFRQAASSATTRAEALNNLGNLLASLGRVREAREEIQAALAFDPSFAEAHNNMARVQALEGRFEEALASARRAVALDQNYAEAHYNVGRLLHATGKSDEAIRSYRRAIRCNPKLAEAHFSLGVALVESGQADAARRAFQQTLQLDPAHSGARENLRSLGQ